MGTNQSKKGISIPEKLQTVYEAIKRERPWDIRPVKNIYTTAKEKYMIELIKDGHDISDNTIAHVVGRCYKFHHFDNERYVCWFGFILTREEYPDEHFKCKTFHNLNKRLICSNGAIYYPIDILLNPFGEWHLTKFKVNSEIQDVYSMIEEKWSNDWYEDEMHKYTLKHLIDLIDKGNHVPKYLKQHVVDGCDKDHKLGDSYTCYSGFLMREKKKRSKNKKQPATLVKFNFRHGALHYVMNSKFYDHTGIKDIPVAELKLRRYQTSQKITDQSITSSMKDAKKLFDRICHRNFINPQVVQTFLLTWPETYLMNQVMLGKNIPNEVISHVLEGCYTFGHLLTEQYACCRGYILTRNLFSDHDVRYCTSHHMINQDLKCYKGRVYHSNAEMPCNMIASMADGHSMFFLHDGTYSILSMDLKRKIEEIPRLPNRPAPHPPDHLDQQPLQQPARNNIPVNDGAHMLPQNDGEQDVVGNKQEDLPARPHLRHNRVSPPPEIEI